MDNLFDSPPGPGPSRPLRRSPSRSVSRTPSPSAARRGGGGDEPLFLSPNGTATPVRSRPQAEYHYDEPERDPFEEPSRRPGGGAGGAGGSGQGGVGGGIRTADLGNYDPLAPILGDEDADGPARKKRKPIPKIDAERLMGEYGLPALMKDAKRFKVRGKGHEAQDLKSLLSTYQIWAHRMFPKGDFLNTVGRVENVLRTRRMENAMKGYREAFHPHPPSPPNNNPISNYDQGYGDGDHGRDESPTPQAREGHHRPTSSPPPLFDEPDMDIGFDEEIDLDEMAAMEEMEREERLRISNNKTQTMGDDGSPPPMEEEDDWEGLYD